MKKLFSISGLQKKAGILHLFGVIIAIVTLATAHGAWATPPNPCTSDMKNCISQTTGSTALNAFETRHFDVYCPKSAPYYQGKWKQETDGWVSVVTWSWSGLVGNDREHFSTTNWSTIDTHHYNISIACSSSPPTGICVADPGCPDDEGTRRDQCAGGGENEMCWSNWNERCSDGTYCNCSTVALRVCCNCERK